MKIGTKGPSFSSIYRGPERKRWDLSSHPASAIDKPS
jgi:hypothetical protein